MEDPNLFVFKSEFLKKMLILATKEKKAHEIFLKLSKTIEYFAKTKGFDIYDKKQKYSSIYNNITENSKINIAQKWECIEKLSVHEKFDPNMPIDKEGTTLFFFLFDF